VNKIDLAFAALGHFKDHKWNKKFCTCDLEANMTPCEYCAIHGALIQAQKLKEQLLKLKETLEIISEQKACCCSHLRDQAQICQTCLAKEELKFIEKFNMEIFIKGD